jgi:hypothetical protein
VSSDEKNHKTAPDGAMAGPAPGTAGTEETITQSQSIPGTIDSTPSPLTRTGTQQKVAGLVEKEKTLPEAGTITTLAIWDIVPNSVPDLTGLSRLAFNDLLLFAKSALKAGRLTHDVAVAAFRAIMDRYDGRKSTRPPMTVQAAFASIGVNYDAARKLVYRDRKKRDLEAIAANLNLPPGPEVVTSIFHIGDGVTISDGKGVVGHVHQTTGKIDVVLEDGDTTITNVSPKRVTMLNGAAVIDGKVVKQKEHVVVAGDLLIDPILGKKWTYCDNKFAVSNLPTRQELKQAAIEKLMEKRAAALKRKEEEKKARKDEADRKDSGKVNAAKGKREAAQAKREAQLAEREAARLRKEEEVNKRKAEAAQKKAAKIEAAKAKKETAAKKKEEAARRAREKKAAKAVVKAAAKASNKRGKGGEHVPSLCYGVGFPPVVVGSKSEPTPHGFLWEFVKDEKPYAVRDENNPHVGIMTKFKSKGEADRYINEREREAASMAA